MKLTDTEIETLYEERCKIENFCKPRQKTVEEIVRENWQAKGRERMKAIDEKLSAHFFPDPPEEGTHRLDTDDFHVMYKASVTREFDTAALPIVEKKLTEAQREALISYKASLRLKKYRDMPDKVKAIINEAIIKTPGATSFEITRNEK